MFKKLLFIQDCSLPWELLGCIRVVQDRPGKPAQLEKCQGGHGCFRRHHGGQCRRVSHRRLGGGKMVPQEQWDPGARGLWVAERAERKDPDRRPAGWQSPQQHWGRNQVNTSLYFFKKIGKCPFASLGLGSYARVLGKKWLAATRVAVAQLKKVRPICLLLRALKDLLSLLRLWLLLLLLLLLRRRRRRPRWSRHNFHLAWQVFTRSGGTSKSSKCLFPGGHGLHPFHTGRLRPRLLPARRPPPGLDHSHGVLQGRNKTRLSGSDLRQQSGHAEQARGIGGKKCFDLTVLFCRNFDFSPLSVLTLQYVHGHFQKGVAQLTWTFKFLY